MVAPGETRQSPSSRKHASDERQRSNALDPGLCRDDEFQEAVPRTAAPHTAGQAAAAFETDIRKSGETPQMLTSRSAQ